MSNESRIRDLTAKALDNFDAAEVPVTTLVRQAHRIAVMRHDYAAQVWLSLQLNDLTAADPSHHESMLKLKRQLVSLLGPDRGSAEYGKQAERYFRTRKVLDSKVERGDSIEQMESTLRQIEQTYSEMTVPPNLTQIDAYFYARDVESAQA